MVKSRPRKTSMFGILNGLLMLFISISTLYPFVYLLTVSFSPIREILSNRFILFPKTITLDAYEYAFRYAGLGSAYRVTIYITVVGTVINLVMTSLGAYVLANRDMPGRSFFMKMIIFTMLFEGGLIPSYLVVKELHMINTYWALMIPGAISTFLLIVMRNFFQGIPMSLMESARIDGCSEYRILLKIVLPLSLPIIATLALFYGVSHWNSYFTPIIYLNDPHKMPLQVLVRSMYENATSVIESDAPPPPLQTVRAATVMIATLPILCVYPFLQKYFVKGMLVGAIKG